MRMEVSFFSSMTPSRLCRCVRSHLVGLAPLTDRFVFQTVPQDLNAVSNHHKQAYEVETDPLLESVSTLGL